MGEPGKNGICETLSVSYDSYQFIRFILTLKIFVLCEYSRLRLIGSLWFQSILTRLSGI